MFRTETTLVVGAGANREIELPDGPELLNRIATGFDFDRLGSEVQSRDLVAFAALFDQVAEQVGSTPERLMAAGRAIRTAASVSPSIEAIMDQQRDNPDVMAVGRLAIIYYTLQAESKSTLAREPRAAGELPLRGQENWLFQLGQMMVSGVPRRDAENCFYRLSIIAFTYDRAIEHYLPWIVAMAFDMDIEEARAMVGTHLRIVYPFGTAGQLPWRDTDKAKADWAQAEPDNIVELTKQIYSTGQRKEDSRFSSYLLAEMTQGKRIGFLGFDFDPLKLGMIFDDLMDHNPDVLVSLSGVEENLHPSIFRMIRQGTGVTDDAIKMNDIGVYELLRDNALILQS